MFGMEMDLCYGTHHYKTRVESFGVMSKRITLVARLIGGNDLYTRVTGTSSDITWVTGIDISNSRHRADAVANTDVTTDRNRLLLENLVFLA
jgi:hypothetical protein